MLQIKHSDHTYEITDKKITAILDGRKIILKQQIIDSPGEYEVAGVEVIYGERAALLVWEKLQAVCLFSTEPPTSFDKMQFASADAVLINADLTHLNKNEISLILENYDPAVIIVSTNTKIEDSLVESMKAQRVSSVKLSDQNLPVEGRDFYQVG